MMYARSLLRLTAITAIVVWAVSSLAFWLKGDAASPLHCLILVAMVFALMLPTGVEKLVRKKWFPLAMSLWLLVIIPTALFAFDASVEMCGECTRLYVPLGVFGCVFFLGYWGLRTLIVFLAAREKRMRASSVSAQLTSDSADERKQGRQSAAACEPS